MDLMKIAEQAFAGEKKEFPAFKAGDQITVGYRIKEGNKERVQEFRGDVIAIHGEGDKKRFTVRKMMCSATSCAEALPCRSARATPTRCLWSRPAR